MVKMKRNYSEIEADKKYIDKIKLDISKLKKTLEELEREINPELEKSPTGRMILDSINRRKVSINKEIEALTGLVAQLTAMI